MSVMAGNPNNGIPVIPMNPLKSSSSSQIPFHQRPHLYSTPLLENSGVSPQVQILCNVLAEVPVSELEPALTSCGVSPLPEYVQEVLKLSYGSPSAAIKFFRWAGISNKHTAYSWNLMVDLLGKNGLFETMWDAIRSMKQEGMLSMATFASIFGSYCRADKINEAIMTFDVMDRYGVPQDVVAVNSLLSAICRGQNQTSRALDFFDRVKAKVSPDADSFAILLEGWEKEGNVSRAKTTFGEMVIRVGWSPHNMSAYDAFLTTLVRGSQPDEAIKFLQVMKGKNCLPGMKFFSNALDILVKQNDSSQVVPLWDIMVDSGLVPNLIMYNAVIGLLCNNNEIDKAFRLLDEMVFHGAFPDSLTYNMIFQCLIKNKKVRKAASFFVEMTKNEWPPTHTNCVEAIKMFFDKDDPEAAIELWNYMVENHVSPIDRSSNELLIGISNLGRISELRIFVEDMLDRRIDISDSTMSTIKSALCKKGRTGRDAYERISRRWKAR